MKKLRGLFFIFILTFIEVLMVITLFILEMLTISWIKFWCDIPPEVFWWQTWYPLPFFPDVFATWNSGCIKSKIFLDLNLPVLNNQCWCIYMIQISNGTNSNRQSINQSLKLGFQYFNTLIEWLYNFYTYVQAYWKTLRYNFAKTTIFQEAKEDHFHSEPRKIQVKSLMITRLAFRIPGLEYRIVK